MSQILIQAKDLTKYFPVRSGLLRRAMGWIKAVDGIDFSIVKGETFGLVGESGCGKTTASKLVLLLETLTRGSILFRSKDITQFTGEKLKEYRRSVQAVFQDPYSSLSPRMRIKDIVAEPLAVNHVLPKPAIIERVQEILAQVGLDLDAANNYPHEFSGGQRQRIAIARAIVLQPNLVILDEPVSSLDVSIRAQVINLLRDLQDKLGLTYWLIAHDLAVVKHMSNRIGVMHLGKIVELAGSDELYTHPLHPYTVALHAAVLPPHPKTEREEAILPDIERASHFNLPTGCRFHARCSYSKPTCRELEPALVEVSSDHQVACHLYSKAT